MADNQDDYSSMDFDEKLEIEKLQATIRNMSNFSDDSEGFLSQSPRALMDGGIDESASDDEFDPYAEIEKPAVKSSGPRAKKFVVMVNSENVEFFDKIPMEDRTQIFNKLLGQYKNGLKKQKDKIHLIKFTKHTFVAIMTVLISLPIMFIIVNKSIELTIKNYKDSQQNFEKLYESRNSRINSTRRTVY